MIELSSVLAGPAVGMFFAELGAEVIKVENSKTNGDVTRNWKLISEDKNSDVSAYFSSVNWGKKSVTLDLKNGTDLEKLYKLINDADILISNFKPGSAEKLKLDYKTLSKLNPKLIYAHITGYGEENSRAGFDAIIQAESGFMFMNGEKNTAPIKMPVALMDVLCAHQVKQGILLALLNREQTGKGEYVHVSLFQAALSTLVNQAANYLFTKKVPQRIGSEHPNIVPYGRIFYTKDEQAIVLAVGTNKQFEKLCEILELDLLDKNPELVNNQERVNNRELVNGILEKAILKLESKTLMKKIHEAKIPTGLVNDLSQTFETPGAKDLLFSSGKGVRSIAFSNHERLDLSEPPSLGQDNDSILG